MHILVMRDQKRHKRVAVRLFDDKARGIVRQIVVADVRVRVVAADEGARIAAQYDAVMEGREMSSRTSYVIGRDGRITAVHSDLNPARHVEAMLAGLVTSAD